VGERGIAFLEVDSPYDDFTSVLCVGDASGVGFLYAARRCLKGQYYGLLKGKWGRSIDIAIKQGILLFKKTESLSWELIFSLKEAEELQGLIRESLFVEFISAFPQDRRPSYRPSRFKDWIKIDTFPGQWLSGLSYSQGSQLYGVRSLQTTVIGPQIFFIGGCPVDGGYLGVPMYLPGVRVNTEGSVEIQSVPEGGEGLKLIETDSDSMEFSYGHKTQLDWAVD